MLLALLVAGCSTTRAPAPTITPQTTVATQDAEQPGASELPTEAAPTAEITRTRAVTPLAKEEPNGDEALIDEDLGLAAGRERLLAALAQWETGGDLALSEGMDAHGRPLVRAISADGNVVYEIIGAADAPVTASVAALLPEDVATAERARDALLRLIQVAMPERAWAEEWLSERLDDALEGTPFSATHEYHYVQVLVLTAPEPFISLAVTLEPRTLATPAFHPAVASERPDGDLTWDRLPIMPAAVRGQALPTDQLELFEFSINAMPDDVEAFYVQEMRTQGWQEDTRDSLSDPRNPGQRQIVLTFRRNGEGALISIDRYPGLDETLVTLGYAEDARELPSVAG